LKYEQIYDYRICSECEKLKERNNIEFKIFHNHQKNTNVCTECKKIKIKKYNEKYLKANKTNKAKYDLNYYNENKEKRKRYFLENKEIRKNYMAKYQKKNKEKLKNYMIEYNERYYEENKEIRKEYQNSPASEELVQKLELYEEVNGNQIKCRYCGDWCVPTNMEVKNRLIGISNNDTCYIYCSEECKEACPTYRKILYPKGFKPASSREVNPVLRQIVFERDNYTCQKCFKHRDQLNCPLHCHHITPYVDSPIEGNDPENCITLCKDCHKEVHKIPGCGYNELKCG
jgi:hypothetical protein